MFKTLLLSGAVALGMAGAASAATVVFQDDFNTETPGLNASLSNWTVSDGTIDVIPCCGGQFDFYPFNGLYVDMDGSTGNAGTITTNNAFATVLGQLYTVTFDYGANGNAAEVLDIIFAGVTQTLNIPAGGLANLTTITFNFVGTGLASTLAFAAAGGDNRGPVVDNIVLSAVPLPAGGLLLLTAIGGVAALRRRKA